MRVGSLGFVDAGVQRGRYKSRAPEFVPVPAAD